VVREYLYDADRDEFHQDREWIDEGRRARTQLMDSFKGLRLARSMSNLEDFASY